MPTHKLPITTIITTLENGACFAEALFFPEILRYDSKYGEAVRGLQANVKKAAESLPLLALHRRHPAGEPVLDQISVTIEAPPKSPLWQRPVSLTFKIVAWLHGEEAALAFIPALGIEVFSIKPPTIEAVKQAAIKQILAELARRRATASLETLALLQRDRELELIPDWIELSLSTPKQIAVREEQQEDRKKSVLAEAATDLTKQELPAAFEMEETVARIAEALAGRNPRGILLVGRSGVGKTAALHELVRRRGQFQLGSTKFFATNGSRLVAGMSGFGQWQERCAQLWREAARDSVILCLGNLIELMEVGKSIGNSQGIADFLRPYIARGDVPAIAECTPEQASLIGQTSPRMLDAFERIEIEEPGAERGRRVLLHYARAHSQQREVQSEAIDRIDRLHRRYAAYSAYPGRPIRFLQNLLRDTRGGQPLNAEHVTAAFSAETGLPRVLLEESERLDLDAAREWFASRVIGQPEAIDLIVDLLALVKADLVRPRKPIASLLFIGPTGVGKTEMAKSLAEFLFQDRNRMVRFDMSEYADPAAVRRLIGGVPASGIASGLASGLEGLLTAKVREQPFAVLLFDEFEKADPSFFDLLLQVLGEGRLTDTMGRVADFSNAVVIMTSNLGAQSFQRGIQGFGEPRANRVTASKHFTTAVRNALRPEMFNRIDRIVPFAPLDETTVLAIAVREVERIKLRDGIRYRRLNLQIADGVTGHLAARGYDVRYGARPLKRAVERELLAPLAEALNQRPPNEPLRVDLFVEDGRIKFNFEKAGAGAASAALAPDASVASLARECTRLRRSSQALERSAAVRDLQNELFSLQRIEDSLRQNKNKWKTPEDLERLARLPKLKALADAIKEFAGRITRMEDETMRALYGLTAIEHGETVANTAAAAADWLELLRSLYAHPFKTPDNITLALFGEDRTRLFELTRAYFLFAMRRNGKVAVCQFTAKPANRKEGRKDARKEKGRKKAARQEFQIDRKSIEKPEEYLTRPQDNVSGLALGLEFPRAFPMLELERGLHTFVTEGKLAQCLVVATNAAFDTYRPPPEYLRASTFGTQEKRRTYNLDQALIDDRLLDQRDPWHGYITVDLLDRLIESGFHKKVWAMLE